MPRPLPAAVKSLPARVAGGKPSEAADGVGPAWPLFAPAITTTATPKTTMARIGIATLIPQPRNSRPFTNSRDQRRLTGWGSSERSRPAHSAPAARPAGPSSRRRRPGRPGAGRTGARPGTRCRTGALAAGTRCRARTTCRTRIRAGRTRHRARPAAGPASTAGWLTVGVYRNRRGSAGSGPGCARGTRPWPGWPGGVRRGARAGRGRRCSNSNPGAVPLHGSSSG